MSYEGIFDPSEFRVTRSDEQPIEEDAKFLVIRVDGQHEGSIAGRAWARSIRKTEPDYAKSVLEYIKSVEKMVTQKRRHRRVTPKDSIILQAFSAAFKDSPMTADEVRIITSRLPLYAGMRPDVAPSLKRLVELGYVVAVECEDGVRFSPSTAATA